MSVCSHVINTSHIQAFTITGLTGQSQAVKKIAAVTSHQALEAEGLLNELRCDVISLIDDVKDGREPETWPSRHRHILKVSGFLTD